MKKNISIQETNNVSKLQSLDWLNICKDIKNKLYDLIVSTFNDKSMLNAILLKQRQHSDKDIFKNLNNHIEEILNEKN